jgi:hypothetical protein
VIKLREEMAIAVMSERDAHVAGSSGDLGRVHSGSGQDLAIREALLLLHPAVLAQG